MARIIDPGKHTGKITDYGISKTSKGKKQAFIVFDVNGVSITWYGGLDPIPSGEGKKAQLEYTVKTLLDCGLSTDVIETMAGGTASNALPAGKEMDLVIEDNDYQGTISSRIKWINEVGVSVGPPRLTYEEVAAEGTGALRAELMRQRKMKEIGKPVPQSPI